MGRKRSFLNLNLMVHKVTTGLEGVYELHCQEHKICFRVAQTLSARSYAYSNGAALHDVITPTLQS